MKRVAYLVSKLSLPGSCHRRSDGVRHDEDYKALSIACLRSGIELVAVDWEQPADKFSKFSAAIVRSTWDYPNAVDRFLDTIQEIEASCVPVYNRPALIEWNINKTYLKELSDRGVGTIPTIWLDAPTSDDLARAFEELDTDRVVAKRQIGSSAYGQDVYVKHELPERRWIMDRPGMLQPFFESIVSEGEYSFIFIDGQLSHAVLKKARSPDYRVQPRFGGRELPANPSQADLSCARAVMDRLPGDTPMVARVDMVRDTAGRLVVMEVELIEPFLFPRHGSNLGPLFAAALRRRI